MQPGHYTSVLARRFDSDAVKGVNGRVLIGSADGAQNFCMRIFEIDPDGFTPRHSHEWEHEIFFHSGSGEVFRDGKWQPVSQGHAVFIPGGMEHQIRNISPEPLIFVCLIPSGAPEL